MSRQARIVIPGQLHHVTQRGNYKQDIFNENYDRVRYLKYVEEYSRKYKVDVFAFCLMNNHVHFIVRPHELWSLASCFGRAHKQYSDYFHQKQKIKGHLWQERYYSCVLYGDHIPTAIRYVEQNPVRAHMAAEPWHYPWSSARAHLGKKYRTITIAEIKEYISADCWKSFLVEQNRESLVKIIRENTRKGLVAASEEILRDLERQTGVALMPKQRGRPVGK